MIKSWKLKDDNPKQQSFEPFEKFTLSWVPPIYLQVEASPRLGNKSEMLKLTKCVWLSMCR
jgi:hypothetical protein